VKEKPTGRQRYMNDVHQYEWKLPNGRLVWRDVPRLTMTAEDYNADLRQGRHCPLDDSAKWD
jgi:hypothetical protein